ncbi:MAG: cupin domain-containing protein [Deltaproteobacteria bacterium]|nr:cupin domain-containing protein [Deltaproteobacteria bacterium]
MLLAGERTAALVKTQHFELIRMVLPATKIIAEHLVDGPIVLQCLEGAVIVTVGGTAHVIAAGELIHLGPRTPHALEATEDSALLLTVVFV